MLVVKLNSNEQTAYPVVPRSSLHSCTVLLGDLTCIEY